MSRFLMFAAAFMIVGVANAQNVNKTKRGDTSLVITQGNGKWGPPHDAIEVLRVPSTTRETTFGAAYVAGATPDGGVVVIDTKGEEGLIIRRFDANGKFMHNLGRSGRGPGEYGMGVSAIVGRDGRVYVRDDMRSVSIFGTDGKIASSFALNYGNGSTLEIVGADDGSVYVRAPFTRTGFMSTVQRPFFHYDASGKLLDSVTVTKRWLPEGVEGYQWWQVLPDNRVVFTRSDKVGFMIAGIPKTERRPASGSLEPARELNVDLTGVRLLIGEVPAPRVPYLPEERAEIEVARNLGVDKCGGRGGQTRVVIPETKLPAQGYAPIDLDGRIWIQKTATAVKSAPRVTASCGSRERGSFKAEQTYEEPPVFAAFQTDGTYLGEVRFPLRSRVAVGRGNTAWALVVDADDVQTLVKYRLY